MLLCAGFGLILAGTSGQAPAQIITPETPLVRHLALNATYVKEVKDQAWHIRMTDIVPTPPGLYVIVYNEKGEILKNGPVPSGTYTPEAPYVMDMPADGVAQQYVIKLLGVNANCNAVDLPMTDLPFEVYEGRGGSTFVMPYPVRGELRRLAFQVKPGAEKISMMAGDQILRILDSQGAVVADNRPADGSTKATKELTLTARAGETYWLDPVNANQFQTTKGSGKVYFTFDPQRWFYPAMTWELDSRPWMKGLFKE